MLWSGFLSPWLKKREQKRENFSFRYLNSVSDVYFGHSFLQQHLYGQALTFGDREALQIAGLLLFLIISFSRFQYFNLHFGSLKLCFTNLVLEIQDNLSLIFLSSLEISNLIYFTHFRLSPIIMGHISKFKARFVQFVLVDFGLGVFVGRFISGAFCLGGGVYPGTDSRGPQKNGETGSLVPRGIQLFYASNLKTISRFWDILLLGKS